MRRRPRPSRGPLLSPFLVWRFFLVSGLFLAGALAVFFAARARGYDVELARTMVVNTIVVFEIFYLFNVRYLHAASISLRGALGTPAVLLAVVAVILAQMAFTYLPAMQAVFDSRSLPLRSEEH